MKKNIFIVACFLCVSIGFSQEVKFGFTAGYLNLSASTDYWDSEVSENHSGFFAGLFGDFTITEAFHFEPAVIYGNADNLNILFIPVLAKYYLGGTGFNLIAGPQGSMILDEMDPAFKRLGWDLSFGAGYDVTERIFFRARYSVEITNRINNNLVGATSADNSRINSLFAGVGYKF